MDYEIFNVRTDVNACDCTWGCTDTVKGFALKVDSGREEKKNPLLHRGIEPASAACRSDALPTELHPQLQFVCLFLFKAGATAPRLMLGSGMSVKRNTLLYSLTRNRLKLVIASRSITYPLACWCEYAALQRLEATVYISTTALALT